MVILLLPAVLFELKLQAADHQLLSETQLFTACLCDAVDRLHFTVQPVVEQIGEHQPEQHNAGVLLDIVLHQALQELVELQLLLLPGELFPSEEVFEEGVADTPAVLLAAGAVYLHETQQLDAAGWYVSHIDDVDDHLQKLLRQLLVLLDVADALQEYLVLAVLFQPNEHVAERRSTKEGVVEAKVHGVRHAQVVLDDVG